MNRIFSAFTAILLTLSLTACGATKDNTAAPADDPSAAASQDVTVRIGLTGTFNEDIWAPAAEEPSCRKGSIWNLSSSRISLCLMTP